MKKFNKGRISNWIKEKAFYKNRLELLQKVITASSKDEGKTIVDDYLHRTGNDIERESRPWFLYEITDAKDCLKELYKVTSLKNKQLIKKTLHDTGESLFAKDDGVPYD